MSEDIMRAIAYELSNSAGKTILIREYREQIESFSHTYPDDTMHPLVRLSDALTKLAEKDAEISRLRSALEEIEMGIDALPDELECGGRMTAREMRRQALEVVKAEVKALKGPEA